MIAVRGTVVLVVGTLLLAACAQAPLAPNPDAGIGVATLKWQPPTTYENGEPLKDLAAYVVLYGRSPDDFRYAKQIEDAKQTSLVLSGLGTGPWYFTILAVNSHGQVSPQADVVSKVIY